MFLFVWGEVVLRKCSQDLRTEETKQKDRTSVSVVVSRQDGQDWRKAAAAAVLFLNENRLWV